jgi:ADP-ribose pyrophosphatase YjhB (NUDIX family)
LVQRLGRSPIRLASIDKRPNDCYDFPVGSHWPALKLGGSLLKREYPEAPIVAVGLIIRQEDRIALVRRAKEPSKGCWTFPGGAVKLGETVYQAAGREALEETGLEVRIDGVADVVDTIVRDSVGRVQYHYVIVDLLASVTEGALAPDSDATEARWVGLRELAELDVTEKARAMVLNLLDPNQ